MVITGFSGAGKSQAMATFEDAGYFCVDNLPPEMIGSLADLFGHEGSKVERAAVASDTRGGEYFDGLIKVLEDLDTRGVPYRLLFLEASDEALINRFKETRRRHPLANGGSVESAIGLERERLAALAERADVSIDTSDLSASRLRKVVADKMLPHGKIGRLAVTFMTFGFKHGSPRDADLTFDVRFLPNPHYEAELRELTGLDDAVVQYVEESDGIGEFYERLDAAARLPAARPTSSEGKSHLTVGIGCTGGRHRSVVIAEHLARIYARPRRPARRRRAPRRGQAAAPRPEGLLRGAAGTSPDRFTVPRHQLTKEHEHGLEGRNQRLRAHRPQRLPGRARDRRRHRLGRRQRHHRHADTRPPAQVRLGPRARSRARSTTPTTL